MRGPWRQVRLMRGFLYRGFRVELVNSYDYRPMKFEYRVYSLARTRRLLRDRRGRLVKVTYDPASSRTVGYAVTKAKRLVDELRSPFWWKKPWAAFERRA
jgi:hypothetical protein